MSESSVQLARSSQKRGWAGIVVVSTASLLLAACSSGSSTAPSSAPTSSVAAAATSAPAGASAASSASAPAGASAVATSGSTAVATSAAPTTMTTIKMVQEWPVPDGFWIPWVVAQDKGYYKAAGIKLTIIPPPNTAATAQYLGTGRADIAFDTSVDIVFGRAQKAPMVSIGNYGKANNWGLISSKAKPLNFADIKGKTIGTYSDSWSKAQLQIMLQSQGLTLKDVKLVIASSDTVPLLLQKKVDAITGVTNAEGSELASEGQADYNITLAKDHGVPNSPVWVLAANTDWLAKNKPVAQKFMDATLKGWQDAVSDPKAAVATFMRVYPKAQTLAYTTIQWKDTMGIFGGSTITPQTLTQSTSDWTALLSAAKTFKLVNKVDPTDQYFTNELLGGS
jgi:putative hydroxymethylpyrimidine transport system substrate-binding protein